MKISVIAHPNSKNPRIEKDLLNILHVYVRETALENKANEAVIKAVAILLKVPKSSVALVKGTKSKIKTLVIS